MELRHLRYFDAVAEEGHVHRAATRLGLAQPALTQQVKALEREMGVQLLVRTGRGIALTDVGRAFHAEAKAILAQVRRAVATAQDMEAGRAGVIRIGFTESASFHPVVTRTLKRFRSEWSEVECALEEKHTEALISALEDGSLDAAFVRPPVRYSSAVVFRALLSEPMAVVLPAGHSLAHRKRLALSALEGESFVVYPRKNGSGLSDAVLAECRRAGFMPRIAQQTPQLSSTINLVAAGMGIAVVPSCMRHQRSDSVRFVPLSSPGLKAELTFATRGGVTRQVVENLVAIATAIFRVEEEQ